MLDDEREDFEKGSGVWEELPRQSEDITNIPENEDTHTHNSPGKKTSKKGKRGQWSRRSKDFWVEVNKPGQKYARVLNNFNVFLECLLHERGIAANSSEGKRVKPHTVPRNKT